MRLKASISGISALVATLLLFGSTVFAQETTGSIVGTVKDRNGGTVAGATVTATIPSQGNREIRRVVTSDDGAFSIPNVIVNTYSVTVEAPNFKKSVQTAIKVEIGQRREVEVVLEAGNISEVVTVESTGLAVEASIPQSSTTITGTQATELSVNNRNWVQLITLAPGVTDNLADLVPVGSFSPDGSPNIMAISVNGARQSQNTYTVDGADITDRGSNITIQASPSLDSIGEFKVLRALYPAESGRSGGGQINVVTRSGTDQFHGTFFEFVRNDVFNANNYLVNRDRRFGVKDGKAKKSPFRYNNYGFTVGGPVWFLNFGERDADTNNSFFGKIPKTYFFFSEERRNERRYLAIGPSNVPTAGMRNGVFTNPVCISGTQTTGGVRTCNQILPAGTPLSSVAQYDPASAAYLNNIYAKMPLPDSGGTALSAYPDKYTYDFQQEVIKIDTSLTADWSAYYRYQRDKVPFYAPNGVFTPTCAVPFLCPSATNAPGRTHSFQTTYTISPNLILEGRFNRAFGGIFITTEGLLAAKNSPIPLTTPYPRNDARVPLHTGFTTLSNLQGYGDGNNFSVKNEYATSLTWIANGKHTFKFGGSLSFYRKNEDQLGGSVAGTFSSFANTVTPEPTGFVRGTICVNTANQAIACPAGLQTTEQQFANFLLGRNVIFTQNRYNTTADFRQKNTELYAQDEFRFRKNLTLYAGVRYSYFGPPWDANGLLNNFVPELYNAAQAPQLSYNGTTTTRVSGTGNLCNGIITNTQQGSSLPQCNTTPSPYGKYVYETPKNNFGPRVGIAWDVTGKGETVIRTGYGIYHDQVLLGNVELQLGNPNVFQETVTFTGGTLSNPQPAGTTTAQAVATGVPANIRAVPTYYRNPYMQHWSLDLQHLLTKKTFVSVGYYGSKGTHLIGVIDINNLPAGYALTQTCQTSLTTTGPCQARAADGTPIAFGTAAGAQANEQILDQIRPYKGYRAISMVKPIFNSNYHSLQVQATHRFTSTSNIQLSYTWGKNLTDNQTDRSTAPMNSYDIAREYGRAQLDRRHVVRLNYIYELPFFREQRGFAGKLLGGWQISGITSFQSGLPYTLTIGGGIYDPAGLGYFGSSPAGARPNLTCDPNQNAPRTLDEWFNTSCVQTVYPALAPAVPGNSPRGAINGPTLFKSDATMTKNVRWGTDDRYKLQFKVESFNIFNQTNFGAPATVASTARTVSSTTGFVGGFGVIGSVRDPRTFQFGIKFSY
jgi:hypothetical protein